MKPTPAYTTRQLAVLTRGVPPLEPGAVQLELPFVFPAARPIAVALERSLNRASPIAAPETIRDTPRRDGPVPPLARPVARRPRHGA